MSATTGTRGRAVRSGGSGPGGRRGGGRGGGGRISRDVLIDAVVGLAVTALLLAGLARPGFPLLRDWVATPRPPLSDAALGLGESAARAVPQDVALAWASRALAGVGLPVWPLTGLLTAVFCVWLAVAAGALVRQVVPGLGGRLATEGPRAGVSPGARVWLRLPAVVVAVWNPFVVERLLQGHWSLLAGVAAVMTMPVLLARADGQRRLGDLRTHNASFRVRKSAETGHSGCVTPGADGLRVAGACAALAIAGLTPTGWVLAVIAAAMALTCADATVRRKLRAGVALTVTAAVTALPWLLATALAGTAGAAGSAGAAGPAGAAGAAATGVAAFAARAEPGIGTLGSVVALGGIWNSEAVPPSRGTWWAAAALALLLVVWALAARGLWRARHTPAVRATVPLAIVVWLLVALAATGPGLAALDALVGAVPGAGLLRDTQKFVALALPATVLAFAFATRALAPRLRPVGAALAVAAVAIAAVPDAPGALWDQLRPVTYGPGWSEVAAIVDGEPGDLLVLPAGSFRSTPLWAGGRAVLDPAPRLLDARVLVPGDLVVGGAEQAAGQTTVSGEGDRARRATEALLRGEDPQVLARLGVRWVLDERTSAGPRGESARTLRGAAGQEGAAEEGAAEQDAGQEGAVPPETMTTTTTTRFSNPELSLHELPPPDLGDLSEDADAWEVAMAELPVSAQSASAEVRVPVLVAHGAWLLTLAVALALAVAGVAAVPRRRAAASTSGDAG